MWEIATAINISFIMKIVPCDFHESGTKELQAISGFLVQRIFDLLVTSQETVSCIPTQ